MQRGPRQHMGTAPADGHNGTDRMDPIGTLIVSLGALIVLDLAALQLGGSRRSRTRSRATRSR